MSIRKVSQEIIDLKNDLDDDREALRRELESLDFDAEQARYNELRALAGKSRQPQKKQKPTESQALVKNKLTLRKCPNCGHPLHAIAAMTKLPTADWYFLKNHDKLICSQSLYFHFVTTEGEHKIAYARIPYCEDF
ncbi:hypothetical protein KC887_01445 [Candidatus Kaiserbacteria bacterium]|nr:hypothetical protein [Candidatus Kaiserbacteria bacterium]